MNVLDQFLPSLAADRGATLQPLYARVGVTRMAMAGTREANQVLVDRMAQLDLRRAQRRLRPELYPVVGCVYHLAREAQRALDPADLPADVRDGLRTASTAKTEGEFVAVVQHARKNLERFEGSVTGLREQFHQLNAAIAVIEQAGADALSTQYEVPVGQPVVPAS